MEELKARIRAEGQVLGGGILKVDSLINHQVDPVLLYAMGQEIAHRFEDANITRILTAEVSGIGPALMTGLVMQVPVVYARKRKPVTMMEPVYVEAAPSHTKGGETLLMVSPEYLTAADRILIVDDFLATGKTLHALARLVTKAGAQLVGIATVIEKSFEGGRDFLADLNVRIESLAVIESMDDGQIMLAE
ncbi:MAG: xanthine phosphoribosyltransferase [Chloroflexi bacterium]|nr:xanthine phosphoribosyltransferase [Chloroflexota bacterium]